MSRTLVSTSVLLTIGCSPGPDAVPVSAESAPVAVEVPTLSLVASEASVVITVDVHFARPTATLGPRMAELVLHAEGPVTYERGDALAALTAAGKQLVAQPRDGGDVRLAMFATTNTATLDSGPLARITFRRAGPGPVTFRLLPRVPMFAPSESAVGLHLGEAIVVGMP